MDPEGDDTVIQLKDHSNGMNGEAGDGFGDLLFKCANRLITLKFEDVAFKIKVQKPADSMFFISKRAKSEEIKIIRGITGVVLPGEILGVLGPSGSSKTTLLTALGGGLSGGRLEGAVTYNGKANSSALKQAPGFATEEDACYPHLSVAESLIYAALLWLPKTLTKPEKVAPAETVMTRLGLTNCRNNVIGDHFARGVSAGDEEGEHTRRCSSIIIC